MDWTLESTLLGMASVGIRVSGLLLFAPFFGSDAIAPRIKLGLVIAISALLYPVCGPRGLELTVSGMLRLVVGELLVGLLIGLSAQLVFEAAQFAGQLMGVQVGFSLVNILDPNTQVDTPVLSLFSQTVVMLLFLRLGMHRCLLRAVAASFAYLPAGAGSLPGNVTHELLRAAGGIWLTGVQIAAPLVITTLLADFLLGFLGKASPQLPVLFLGLSIKSLVGLTVLALALKYWPGIFEQQFNHAARSAEQMLHLAH